jgi:hypothetical protein
MTHTAAELREMADIMENAGVLSEAEHHRNKRVSTMLRQAADAMGEREELRKLGLQLEPAATP